jgi:hypothetical protein
MREFVSAGGELTIYEALHLKNSPTAGIKDTNAGISALPACPRRSSSEEEESLSG